MTDHNTTHIATYQFDDHVVEIEMTTAELLDYNASGKPPTWVDDDVTTPTGMTDDGRPIYRHATDLVKQGKQQPPQEVLEP